MPVDSLGQLPDKQGIWIHLHRLGLFQLWARRLDMVVDWVGGEMVEDSNPIPELSQRHSDAGLI
jgi:hypothetical protein